MDKISKILLILTLVHSLCIDVYAQNRIMFLRRSLKLSFLIFSRTLYANITVLGPEF